ncbi:Proline-specific permease [Talaromyces pinophilus]|nr:Proline-specific permease [Talaromyces pinophilus]
MDAKTAQTDDIERASSHGRGSSHMLQSKKLKRGLKERHVQFIALGGTIGTGLFLGIGSALATSGPLSLFLGYLITSIAIWAMPAAWISIILVLIVILNIVAVSIYGEAEFAFASIKIITIIGLLLLAVVIDLGGGPTHDRLGFRYWQHPGAMREYIGRGSTGRFLGFFNTLINAAFAFGGVEQVAVAAGETKNPSKNIPKAIRRVFWRLLFFYVFGSLAVGVLVPYDDTHLLYGSSSTAKSPWLIAISNAGIPVLPHILNAVMVTSAASSANANLYTGSRYLFALAQQGQAPNFLLRCTERGVPIYCVAITGSVGLLTYMTVSSGGQTVFHWFSSLTTIAYLLTWTSICYSHTRFRRALKAANIDLNTLPFRIPIAGAQLLAWGPIGYFCIILLFNGFAVFTAGNWSAQNFVSAYVGLPIFALLYGGYKITMKSKIIPISEIDLVTGQVLDEGEEEVETSGAGPSGLVMAKTLLHHYPKGYFEPIIFDSKPTVGGIWAVTRPDGSISKNASSDFVDCFMRTNLSRFTVSFSDHSWNDESQDKESNEEDMFPQAWRRNQGDDNTPTSRKWTVEWTDQRHSDGEKRLSESFDYLVVASGYFSRPYIPSITGLDQFPQDRIMHSSTLRSNSQILTSLGRGDGKILVVGGSMSGAEAAASIALDLSPTNTVPKTNKPVIHHITTRPFWAVPTYLPANDQPGSFLPLDIVMYDLSRRPPGEIQYALGPVTTERANMVHAYFESLLGSDQTDVAEGLALRTKSEDRNSAPWVAVTDHYPGFVRAGDIVPTLGRVSAAHWGVAEAGLRGAVEIKQKNGKMLKLDNVAAIVFATGFTPFESLSFLPEDVLQSLEYTKNDTVFPIVLDQKAVRNPNIPELGFVGMYRGPYWGVMEMQARSLARQWSGETEANIDTTKVKGLRTTSSRAQFPMGDYVGLMETFAREMHIPRKALQVNTTERTGPVIPARYFESTNTDENSNSSNNMINSLRNLLLDPTEPSSNHKEQQRGLSKTILRALHGPWHYEREILPEMKTVTGQASIRLQKASYNKESGPTTEFIYEEDPSTTEHVESRVSFRISEEDGHIYTARRATMARFKFVNVEKIEEDDSSNAPYQYQHLAKELDIAPSDIERTYVFNMRGVTISSWEVKIEGKRKNTATITRYSR